MKPETIIKKYEACKTAEQKYKFTKSLREALKQCEEFNIKNIQYCPHCKKHIYNKDLVEKYEFWTQKICTNPLNGYLDDYIYEDYETSGFVTYCPLCKNKIGIRKYQRS